MAAFDPAALLEALRVDDPLEALVAGAVTIPRYCRAEPLEAIAMTLYRQPDLVENGPESLHNEVAAVNDKVFTTMREVTQQHYGEAPRRRLELVAIACQESPYGLVRRYIGAKQPVPEWLDDAVRASAAGDPETGEVIDRLSAARPWVLAGCHI